MLADASSARHFVLLDVRGFRNKADRSLRKLEDLHLQRLRVDIKDFQPAGVDGLNQGQKPWVATGKHLCGAATDFTLRCCAASMQRFRRHPRQPAASRSQQDSTSESEHPAGTLCNSYDDNGDSHMQSAEELKPITTDERLNFANNEQGVGRTGVAGVTDTRGSEGCSSEAPGSENAENGMTGHGTVDQVPGEAGVQGFAVATCCHHRCSWQHYVGKPLFKSLDFSPDEFEVISWMTGWALCGHETPAGQAQDDPVESMQGGSPSQEEAADVAELPQQLGTGGVPAGSRPAASNGMASAADHAGPCTPVIQLSRGERIVLGQKCKQLIDAGREDWLVQQGFQVRSVLYIDPSVSGENRLLFGSIG